MKCPKCGYLGFETTDRCRNCQYDFSLAPFAIEPELALQNSDRMPDPTADFDLPGMSRTPDNLSPASLDLDRLFGGEAEPPRQPPGPPRSSAPLPSAAFVPADPAPPIEEASRQVVDEVGAPLDSMHESSDPSVLPFDDGPLPAAPRAARPPLAVRRTTPEIPKNRPRTTRPVKAESALAFEGDAPATPKSAAGQPPAVDTVASLMEPPTLGTRLGAGAIDLALLGAIDAIVVILTLRIAGLQTTTDDLRVLPPIPFLGFLALLAFGYVASFTVAGGQTIGKMLLKLRVIGDDGRPVDAAGGVLRALGCMLVPITLGLSYVPALFTSDHRALHDRLAGTRVVHE
ncbi:MAG: RDD family protein [Acidobacteriota bacterium]|nr:RDD family protein [Acidobacteriota bacterium]